jgi:hypothetical protein
MNHSEPHPDSSDWIALVRGEHSWLAAGRLRRHLKHCPHCAVELKEITSMLAVVKPKEPIVSKALATKTWGALPAGRTTRRNFRPIGLVSGVALAAGAVLFFAMPGGPLQPIPSFASVEEAMRKVHTATWTIHTSTIIRGREGAHKMSLESTCWADLGQWKVAHIYPNHKTVMNRDYNIYCIKAGDLNDLYEISINRIRESDEDKDKWIDDLIYFQNWNADKDNKMKDNLKSVVLKSDRLFENGNEYIRYSKNYKREYKMYSEGYGLKFRNSEIILVDPKTRLVVRRELRSVFNNIAGDSENTVVSVQDNFRYNIPIPSGTFELTPQPGKPVRLADRRYVEVNSEDKRALDQQVKKAIQAWNQNDAKSFGDLFDFYATGQLNSFRVRNNPDSVKASFWRKTWTEHLQKREPYLEYLSYDKLFFHYDSGRTRLYTRTSTSEAFPPPIPMDEVTVGGTATVRLRREPNRVQKRWVTFKFVKRHGQWKLVGIDSSSMPQKVAVKK